MTFGDYEALSFDCYGTLIDWEAGIAAVLRTWAANRGLELDDEALLTVYSKHEAQSEEEHPGDLYPLILARSMRSLGAELGCEVSDEDAEKLARSVPDWPAFDDSHNALRLLGTKYKLIILSNVDRDSFAGSNRRLGVEFTSIVTAQDVGSYKPSRRNFDALLGGGPPPRGRRGQTAPRGSEPVPRSRACEAGRTSHGLDQPPPRPARLGRDAGDVGAC